MLTNSEAWYNVTKAELDYLETVDLMLLRNILKAPKTTPKEMLYLELGCLPLRNLIQKRGMSFLYYILHQDPDSMLFKFLKTQLISRNSKDWATTVLKDMDELKLGISIDDIKDMKKSSFKRMIDERTEEKCLNDLNGIKSRHSKVVDVEHSKLQMRNYFKPNGINQTKEEIQLIFKLRSRMTDIKMNFKGIYDQLKCNACEKEEETQEHIIKCEELLKRNEEVVLVPVYGKIFNGNVKEQVQVARIVQQNMNIKDKMKDER